MELSTVHCRRLKELGVSLLYLFGSYAEGTASPLSDVDLGLVFAHGPVDHAVVYQPLYELCTELFPGRPVDLVFLQHASLELRADAVCHGTVLYQASPDGRAAFEEAVMLARADFAPLQREMDRAILART